MGVSPELGSDAQAAHLKPPPPPPWAPSTFPGSLSEPGDVLCGSHLFPPSLPPATTPALLLSLYSPLVPRAWAGRSWLPAAGPVPGSQAGGGWGVLQAERPRGRGGRGRRQCHRQGQLRPCTGARGARSRPASDHKLLGRLARQRCRARRLRQRRWRRRLRAAGAGSSARLVARRAPPRPRRGVGSGGRGRGKDRRRSGRGTVPSGPQAARCSLQRGRRRAPPYILPGAHPADGGAARGPATGCYRDTSPPHVLLTAIG